MSKNIIRRESDKAKEVARDYMKKGYKVLLEPTKDQLPKELQDLGFIPDLIVISDNLKLVVEVKSYTSIKNSRIAELASKVESISGWDFELVYTNPKKNNDLMNDDLVVSRKTLEEKLERVSDFLLLDKSQKFLDLALVLGWATLESALRAVYMTYKSGIPNRAIQSLVRDSIMLGIIDRSEMENFDSLMNKRNSVVHGLNYSEVTENDIEKLISISRSIIEELA